MINFPSNYVAILKTIRSLSAVFLEDYIKPLAKEPLTEHQIGVTLRLCTVIIGVVSVALVFVVERMSSHVLQLGISIGSVVQGPLLSLFTMGLLCPSINSKVSFRSSRKTTSEKSLKFFIKVSKLPKQIR